MVAGGDRGVLAHGSLVVKATGCCFQINCGLFPQHNFIFNVAAKNHPERAPIIPGGRPMAAEMEISSLATGGHLAIVLSLSVSRRSPSSLVSIRMYGGGGGDVFR